MDIIPVFLIALKSIENPGKFCFLLRVEKIIIEGNVYKLRGEGGGTFACEKINYCREGVVFFEKIVPQIQ